MCGIMAQAAYLEAIPSETSSDRKAQLETVKKQQVKPRAWPRAGGM
jgi:hypothetical protein